MSLALASAQMGDGQHTVRFGSSRRERGATGLDTDDASNTDGGLREEQPNAMQPGGARARYDV